jgi:hypothetical protein
MDADNMHLCNVEDKLFSGGCHITSTAFSNSAQGRHGKMGEGEMKSEMFSALLV